MEQWEEQDQSEKVRVGSSRRCSSPGSSCRGVGLRLAICCGQDSSSSRRFAS